MSEWNRVHYSNLSEFLESQELEQYRKEIKIFKQQFTIEEDNFSIDDIVFDEVIHYPISWWVKALDEDLWWQPKGKYIMLYGWPSTGKTTLTLQVAIENSILWNKVCYLSLEMPKKDFIIQNMRTRAWLKQVWVWDSTKPTQQQQLIMKEFVGKIKDIDIKWYIKQPTLKEFKDIMESLSVNDYDQIIIDNLWMIWRWDNKDEMQLYWEISAFLKEYVDKYSITVLILHHTNKWSEWSNGKRWFSSFRWNWKIADDCDYVIQLQREFLEWWQTQTTIKVEKDRISWRNWYSLPLIFNNWVFTWDVFR